MRTDECPVCEQISLQPETFTDEFEYAGKQLRVEGLERSHCTNCGENSMFPAQIRANQLRIAEAKRESLGLLSGFQIKSVRESLGLSQADAAELFGGGANAFSKYERGEVIQSASMDKLLRAARELPQVMEFLKAGSLAPKVTKPNRGTDIVLPVGHAHSWRFEEISAVLSAGLVLETDWNSMDVSCANDDHILLVRMA